MLTLVRSPQPLFPVKKGSMSGSSRRWKDWLRHRSPAGHTCGWHSYIRIRFKQSEPSPQGCSTEGSHWQRGSSSKLVRKISTPAIGTCNCTMNSVKKSKTQLNHSTQSYKIYNNPTPVIGTFDCTTNLRKITQLEPTKVILQISWNREFYAL